MISSILCLATVIFLEARGESEIGQYAVAEVVLNRVEHEDFPNSICAVVKQPNQFAYTSSLPDSDEKDKALEIARDIIENGSSLTLGATYFHEERSRPYWVDHFDRTTKIGSHIFYKD